MATKHPRHRYPKWLAWPLEIVALLLIVPTVWHYVRVNLQIVFQQWPQTMAGLDLIPYVKTIVQQWIGPVPPGPIPWETIYPSLLRLNGQVLALLLLASLIRNFLPQLRLSESGLQVRRGLGWATIPWSRITMVQTMNLPGDRLVLLVQGRRWRLGPWSRLYSLLWPSGLLKGVVISWHISGFDTVAGTLAANLQSVYGADGVTAVIDDMAYSYPYALIFQPKTTWQSLLESRQTLRDAYTHPKWLKALIRLLVGLLLVLAGWRYLGVWWHFLAGRFSNLQSALSWPLLGMLLRSYGSVPPLFPSEPEQMRQAALALIMAQVSMILVLIAVGFLLNLFPNWLLGAEGVSMLFRKRWLSLPWPAIHTIRETLFQKGGGIILVQADRSALPLWHSLYSLFYGAGLRRGVLFTSLLPGFEDLRQRIHLGIVRAYEKEEGTPTHSILQEHGEAEFLQMLREPLEKLRQLAEPEEEDAEGGGLFRRPLYTPGAADDLPWDHDASWDMDTAESEEEKKPTSPEARIARRRALRAAIALASFSFLLVLLEEALFPPLSRPLALFSTSPISQGEGPLWWLLLAAIIGLLTLLEWPLAAGLLALIAEMYGQPGEFKQTLSLHPRIQSPRLLVGVGLLLLGATGLIQPLFLLWWGLSGVLWSTILLWLSSRELYKARGVANILLVVGNVLYQGLVLLVYFMFH